MAKAQEKVNLVTYKEWFNYAAEKRKTIDWEWFIIDQFVRGNHYAKWNSQTQSIEMTPSSNQVRVVVNKTYSTLRAVRNFVTRYKPKWDVAPTNLESEEAQEQARLAGLLLDSLFDKDQLDLRKKIKELIFHGLKYSIGIWQIGWDETLDEGKGDVFIWVIDPFDFYIDPNATDIQSAKFIIKAVKKTIDDVKNNPNYKNTDDVVPDNKLAASEYKAYNIKGGGAAVPKSPKTETVILKECFYRTAEPNSKGGNVNIVTFTDNTILREEETKATEYPFVLYQSDINPLEIYGEGWVKNLVPLNRVLDQLESQVIEFNHYFAKGRWIIDKDSGVKLITNQNGQIIEKKRGAVVTPVTTNPLPASVFHQIENFNRYIEDVGGAHDASLGRIPTGATAGVAIEALQQGDANNLNDLRENLEDTLVEAGQRILALYARHAQTVKVATTEGRLGQNETFAFIGEKAANKPKGDYKNLPLAVINEKNHLRVSVGTWLGHSKEAQRNLLLELYKAGLLDQQTVLENFGFPAVDEIIERTAQEKQEVAQQPTALTGLETTPSGAPPATSSAGEMLPPSQIPEELLDQLAQGGG